MAIADTAGLVSETAMLAPGSRAEYKLDHDGRSIAVAVEPGRRPAPHKRDQ